jgi:hypothetical protein
MGWQGVFVEYNPGQGSGKPSQTLLVTVPQGKKEPCAMDVVSTVKCSKTCDTHHFHSQISAPSQHNGAKCAYILCKEVRDWKC